MAARFPAFRGSASLISEGGSGAAGGEGNEHVMSCNELTVVRFYRGNGYAYRCPEGLRAHCSTIAAWISIEDKHGLQPLHN